MSSSHVRFEEEHRDGSINTTDIRIQEGVPPSPPPSQASLDSVPPNDVPRERAFRLAEIDDTIVFQQDGTGLVGRFRIANVTETGDPIIFKLKTTSPDKFRCRPTIGMLDAGQHSIFIVTPYDYVDRRQIPNERFQIQVTVLPRALLIEGSGTESESPSNSSRGHDFERLNAFWKISSAPGKYVESHRLHCTLDPSLIPAQSVEAVSMAGSRVTMSEEEMRRGLAGMTKEMSDATNRIVKAKVDPIYTFLYISIGLLAFLVFMSILIWWSMPSDASIAQHLKPIDCKCPTPPTPGGPQPGPLPIPPILPPPDEQDKKYSCLET